MYLLQLRSAFHRDLKAIPLRCNHLASVFQSLWEDNCQLADTDTAFAGDQAFVIFHFLALSLTGEGNKLAQKDFLE